MTYTVLSLFLFLVHCWASPIPLPLPLPQAVTEAIAPSGLPPPGCSDSYPRVFGIAVVNITTSTLPTRLVGRQATSNSPPAPVLTVAQVSQIGDGQIQGGMHTVTMAPVTQIGDGQIQNPAVTTLPRAAATVSATTDDATAAGDEYPCGRPKGSSPALGLLDVTQALPSSTTLTGNPRLPVTPLPTPTPTTFSSSTTTSQSPSSTLASTAPRLSLVSCLTSSTLQLTLSNNNLYDALNRTGYIASNYQFQFDGPPQSGALYTSGWTVCPVASASAAADADDAEDNETTTAAAAAAAAAADSGLMTLALGNSTTFWQCLSGEFYNLYTENWAAQCSPVEIRVVGLVSCGDGG